MPRHRLDYVSFVRRCDEDLMYNTHLLEWNRAISFSGTKQENERKWTSASPNMKQGYCVYTAWGDLVEALIDALPTSWYGSITRVDVRQELEIYNNDQWKAICLAMNIMAPSKIQTAHLKSRPAAKTDRRDTGGHGFRYGSRKSDRSTVYYRRGSGAPCIEFRLQNKAAAKIVTAAYHEAQLNDRLPFSSHLIDHMLTERRNWFSQTLGTSEDGHLDAMLGIAPGVQQAYAQATMFVETEPERQYWENMTAEQQEYEQQVQYDITPKGAPHLTQNKPPHLLDYGEGDISYDDDMPF